MKILNMRAARTLACVGMYAYDAEMKIETDEGKIVYLHANYYDGDHFTVANYSIFDYMIGESTQEPGNDYIENYDSLNDSVVSAFYLGFKELDKFVDEYIEWRQHSGDNWLLEKMSPDIQIDRKVRKSINEYNIINERISDSESSGFACGPASIYVVEAEVETIEDGVHFFYQGEWVDAASDLIFLCKRSQSVFDRQLDENFEPDENSDNDVIEKFNSLEEASESQDAAIYSKLYKMITELVEIE